MGGLRAAVLACAIVLATAAEAAAAPSLLGSGTDPGVAVDQAGTAHVAWLRLPAGDRYSVEYCQIPPGRSNCSVRQSYPLSAPGIADVQVLAPRPGTVIILAPVLNDPALLLTSVDGGATFTARASGGLPVITQSVFGPGETIAVFSGVAGFARYGVDGSGPPSIPLTFGDATEALSNTLVNHGAGYAAFFAGASDIRSVLWNGVGDPNIPQSWVEGPRIGGERLAPAAMGGPSGTYVAYTDRRGPGTAVRVRRLSRSGRLRRATRLSPDDPTTMHAAQGPRGNMIVLWRPTSTVVRYVSSRKGRRWTRPRTLFRGHDPVALRPVLGRRSGWMVWGSGGSDPSSASSPCPARRGADAAETAARPGSGTRVTGRIRPVAHPRGRICRYMRKQRPSPETTGRRSGS